MPGCTQAAMDSFSHDRPVLSTWHSCIPCHPTVPHHMHTSLASVACLACAASGQKHTQGQRGLSGAWQGELGHSASVDFKKF